MLLPAALLYLRQMLACRARMANVIARGLAAYLQQWLEKAYSSLLDDARLVLMLTALNLVASLAILDDARLVPTFLWRDSPSSCATRVERVWYRIIAFASTLFVLTIVFSASRIILQMFDLLMRNKF